MAKTLATSLSEKEYPDPRPFSPADGNRSLGGSPTLSLKKRRTSTMTGPGMPQTTDLKTPASMPIMCKLYFGVSVLIYFWNAFVTSLSPTSRQLLDL